MLFTNALQPVYFPWIIMPFGVFGELGIVRVLEIISHRRGSSIFDIWAEADAGGTVLCLHSYYHWRARTADHLAQKTLPAPQEDTFVSHGLVIVIGIGRRHQTEAITPIQSISQRALAINQVNEDPSDISWLYPISALLLSVSSLVESPNFSLWTVPHCAHQSVHLEALPNSPVIDYWKHTPRIFYTVSILLPYHLSATIQFQTRRIILQLDLIPAILYPRVVAGEYFQE